jgi:hypothetical protein
MRTPPALAGLLVVAVVSELGAGGCAQGEQRTEPPATPGPLRTAAPGLNQGHISPGSRIEPMKNYSRVIARAVI